MRFGSRSVRLVALGGLASLALAASASAAPKPGTWTSLAPLPTATEGLSAGSVDNLVVGAYGFKQGTGDSDQTVVYNIASNTWRTGSTAPGGPSSEGIGVSKGHYFYALGSRDFPQEHMNNRYDPKTDTWTQLAPMPTGRGGLGAAVVDNSIYAVGGRVGGSPCQGASALDTVERYDIKTNTWTTAAPLPTPLSDIGVIAHGNRIYVFGGCTSAHTVVNTVYIYDRKTDSWSQGAPMPTARAAFYGVGIKGDRIYVMGGQSGPSGPVSSANEVYSISHNSWSTDTPMPHPRGEMGVASHGGRIYTVGGGIPAYGTPQDTNDVFKP